MCWRFCAGLSPQRLKILHVRFPRLPCNSFLYRPTSSTACQLALGTNMKSEKLPTRPILTRGSMPETFDVVWYQCGKEAAGGPHPGVQQAHIIGKTEDLLWDFLKNTGFVPSIAKSVVHEPRNGINLCV
ncbi:hypothetical protein M378DRAFT_767943 [Amanita muscaria Koide BX008]|uniref:Uncharacterized protein n=1 Tax=Amanita muscaria (strain Koide BX008) TaxID=946122 RepID=A0A0C2T038_AMAMK|nr:hypothetical protein M378DRAFT_767943 [Amanita muscaria Koide BX008]